MSLAGAGPERQRWASVARRNVLRAAIWIVLAAALMLGAAVYLPTGWVIVSPGTVLPLLPATEVTLTAGDSAGVAMAPRVPGGEVLLLTVSARKANIYRLAAWAMGLLPDAAAMRASELVPTGISDAEYLSFSAEQMRESIGIAATLAHQALGLPAKATGSGARVVVNQGAAASPDSDGLHTGDIILAAGTPVAMSGDLAPLLRSRAAGESILLEVLRSGRLTTVSARLQAAAAGAEEAMLGVVLGTVNARFEMQHTVRVETGEITGPSGGLALALAIRQLLGAEDILAGRVIAASGYIRADRVGSIGPVGGVTFKALAAQAAGAEIMLVHPTNVADAEAAGTNLTIVPVTSVADAVAYLRRSSLTGPK